MANYKYVRNSSTGSYRRVVEKSSDCFVATAVYEDANAQQLDVLRHYRDNVLGNNVAGRAFVSFYYSGAGKTVAKIVKKHTRFAIPSIRKRLDGLVDRHARDLINS